MGHLQFAQVGAELFYGAGAGGVQTASAVLGDLVSAARRHVVGGPGVAESTHADLPILPISSVTTRYQITLSVLDRPGVLAQIATLFSEHGVSVEAVQQSVAASDADGRDGNAGGATLVIGTHRATEAALAATVADLADSPVVARVDSVLRVEGL